MKKLKMTNKIEKKLDRLTLEVNSMVFGVMDDLLDAYKRGMKINPCPLCSIRGGCDHCPWIVITGESCMGYSKAHNSKFGEDIHISFHKGDSLESWNNWIKIRIPMLEQWIELYREYILKRRKE